MIDFQVAADKIAQFETADEIASFLQEQGIKAIPEAGSDCAIARYIKTTTGIKGVFVAMDSIFLNAPMLLEVVDLEGAEEVYTHTYAMRDFVVRYDMGEFPDLIDPSYDLEHQF